MERGQLGLEHCAENQAGNLSTHSRWSQLPIIPAPANRYGHRNLKKKIFEKEVLGLGI